MGRQARVLVIGLEPSKKTEHNQSLKRLSKWMDRCGVKNWSFINLEIDGKLNPILPYVLGTHGYDGVIPCQYDRWITLGVKVDKAIKTAHFAAPHPSPRNRNFNDPEFEPTVIRQLKRYINGKRDR